MICIRHVDHRVFVAASAIRVNIIKTQLLFKIITQNAVFSRLIVAFLRTSLKKKQQLIFRKLKQEAIV